MSHPNETRLAALEAVLGTDTAAQLAFLAGVTAGTAAASKALVLDGSSNIGTINQLTVTTIAVTTVNGTTANYTTVNAGASGTAGTLNVFPTTAANGKLIVSAVNNTGAFNSTISNSNIGQATVYSLPDAGSATTNFVVDKGNQSIAGTKSFTGTLEAGVSGTAGTLNVYPTTAANGKLVLAAVNNSGAFNSTISNKNIGQSCVYSLQETNSATADIVTNKGIGAVLGAICSATISATSGTTGTTLTNVTGMTVAIPAAGTYAVYAYLQTVSTANSGLKLALAYSGTTTSCVYTGDQNNGTTKGGHSTTTTMGNAVAGATTVTTDAAIEGTIVVSTTGNLTVQFAQNASHADTTSVFINSNMTVVRIA
jgi:hypothetical protein